MNYNELRDLVIDILTQDILDGDYEDHDITISEARSLAIGRYGYASESELKEVLGIN